MERGQDNLPDLEAGGGGLFITRESMLKATTVKNQNSPTFIIKQPWSLLGSEFTAGRSDALVTNVHRP